LREGWGRFDSEYIKVFATMDAAETWFEDNDPEGVAFGYVFEVKAVAN
jgi:hypothetical protein